MSLAFYPPARPLAVTELLDLVIRIFKATAIKCLPYGLCAVIAQQLPNIYAAGSGGVHQPFGGGRPIWLVLFVIGTLLALVAWSALLLRQRAIIEHVATTTRLELVTTLRRFPAFLGATLLLLGAVAGGWAVLPLLPGHHPILGRLLLVVLSVYLAVLLSCTWPAVLVAGLGPVAALVRSARLVWGHWWRVAASYTVGAIVVLVLGLLVGTLIALVVPTLVADIPVMTAVFTVIANAMGAVVAPFVCALVLAVFADLRVRKEGVDLQQRIAELAAE